MPKGKPFKKGQSGNPSGRPRGVAATFRAKVKDDPSELANALHDLATSTSTKPSDRIAAIREYLDRGWGKAPAHAPVEGANPLGLGEVEQAIGATLDDLAQKRAATAARGGEVPAVADRGAARADTA